MIQPIPGGSGFHAVTSQAALYSLDREVLQSGSTQGPIENAGTNAVGIRFAKPLPIDDKRSVLVDQVGGESILVYDPTREKEKLRRVTMQLPAGKPSGGAVVAGGGVFLPLDTGRAVLVNYQTGAMMATPFQPKSNPVANVAWTNPVPLPDDPDQVVVADSRKNLYRLRVAEQLRELASKDVEYRFLGTATGVGPTFVATTAGPAADFLVGFDMTTLEEKFKTLLDGRITWGPVAVGDWCLVQTEDQMLRGFSAVGEPQFEIPLPAGDPVGDPLMLEDSVLMAGHSGWLVRMDFNTGKMIGQTDLEQPISATPLPVGNRVLVPGAEGVIYIIEVPNDDAPQVSLDEPPQVRLRNASEVKS